MPTTPTNQPIHRITPPRPPRPHTVPIGAPAGRILFPSIRRSARLQGLPPAQGGRKTRKSKKSKKSRKSKKSKKSRKSRKSRKSSLI